MHFAAIIVISGGASYEHEVSRESAHSVVSYLQDYPAPIGEIYVDLEGLWHMGGEKHQEKPLFSYKPASKKGTHLGEAILQYAHHLTGKSCKPHDVCIFPVMHGHPGEDGSLQGFLELSGFAYVGSGVYGSAISMDKASAKMMCHNTFSIPTAPMVFFSKRAWIPDHLEGVAEALVSLEQKYKYKLERVIVKPNNQGSSVGINIEPDMNYNSEEHRLKVIRGMIEDAFIWGNGALMEPYFTPHLELSCALIERAVQKPGTSHLRPSEVVVLKSGDEMLSYSRKYHSTEELITLMEDEEINHQVKQMSCDIFFELKLSGLARVDWIITMEGDLFFNEVNTLPGLGARSIFLEAWRLSVADKPYVLFKEMIDLAYNRSRQNLKDKKDFSNLYQVIIPL